MYPSKYIPTSQWSVVKETFNRCNHQLSSVSVKIPTITNGHQQSSDDQKHCRQKYLLHKIPHSWGMKVKFFALFAVVFRERERESPTNTLLYRTGSRVVRRFVLWAHLAPESVRFGEPCVVGRHILVEADRTRFTGFRCVVELHTLFTQSCQHY